MKYTTGPFKVLLSFHYQDEFAAGNSADTEGMGQVPTAFSSAVTPGFLNNGFDAAIPPVYGEYQTGIFLREPYHRHIDLTALELSADLGFSTVTSSSSYLVNDSDAVQDLERRLSDQSGRSVFGFPTARRAELSRYDRAHLHRGSSLGIEHQPARSTGSSGRSIRTRGNSSASRTTCSAGALSLAPCMASRSRPIPPSSTIAGCSFRDAAIFGELT